MNRTRITVTAGLVAALSLAGVVACHEEGPAEQAGKAIDEAAESAQEGAPELTKEEAPLDEAGEAPDQAVDKDMEAGEGATQ